MKKPGKKSYVYIQNANGQYGYYILKGLPVTYCVGLLPPEVKQRGDLGQYDGDMVVQGPSMDGTYSSGSNCNTMYGQDAESGAYLEWRSEEHTSELQSLMRISYAVFYLNKHIQNYNNM